MTNAWQRPMVTMGCLDCTKGKYTVTNAWQGRMLTTGRLNVWIVQKVRSLVVFG